MEKDDKIYIAGHRGLVGSAILKRLSEKGYTNLILRTHQELELTDAKAVEAFFAETQPSYVFLAAAHVGGIMANQQFRADFIYNNLSIQQNIIYQSYKHNVKKLLFLGSTCIYPRMAPQPLKEEYLLTSPLEYTNEPYAIAKIAGLKMCECFNLQYGTNFLTAMPTNLYGPNDNFDLQKSHVLPGIMRKMILATYLQNNEIAALKKDLKSRPIATLSAKSSIQEIKGVLETLGITAKEITLWGTGKPLREFLWSEDMADACIYLMERIDFADTFSPTDKEVRNCHINIGSGKEISIQQLATIIAKAVGYKGKILFDHTKPDGTPRKLTDPTKLHQLGWRYQVEIEEGIARLYQWYKQHT